MESVRMCEFSSEKEVEDEGEMSEKRGKEERWMIHEDGFFFLTQMFFSGLFPLLTVLSGFLGNSPFLPTTAKTHLGKVRSSEG